MTEDHAMAAKEVVNIEKAQKTPPGWEPNILAFACHYCAFAAADLAGVMRLPCTGKLDAYYVLRALERGVDGVFVAG
jgi:hypothetical protein